MVVGQDVIESGPRGPYCLHETRNVHEAARFSRHSQFAPAHRVGVALFGFHVSCAK